jgi:hypothetical protein
LLHLFPVGTHLFPKGGYLLAQFFFPLQKLSNTLGVRMLMIWEIGPLVGQRTELCILLVKIALEAFRIDGGFCLLPEIDRPLTQGGFLRSGSQDSAD